MTRALNITIVITLLALIYVCQSQDYIPQVKKIIEYGYSIGKGQAFHLCADICDKFPQRQGGSPSGERAADYYVSLLQKEGFEDIKKQPFSSTYWERGSESAQEVSPRRRQLSMLGLGGSTATPPDGIQAEIFVVRSFSELNENSARVKGKIVVYNQPWTGYGSTVQYRSNGAVEAAKHGALAALVRSATPYSLNTPHTGASNTASIPSAAITIEDAEYFQRLQNGNNTAIVRLFMSGRTLTNQPANNVIADFKGSLYPNEVLVFGGHSDNWDVGQGAQDDMSGIAVCFQAIKILKNLGFRPKRTIRLVFWNSEEFGGTFLGAEAYLADQEQRNALKDHVVAFESDAGVFNPIGWGFTGSARAKSIIQEITDRYTSLIGVSLVSDGGCAADNGVLCRQGIPGLINRIENDKYFYYHHSHADTMTALKSEDMDKQSAALAILMYVLGDMNERLPRN
jgi:carboxypeptidase Q